MIVIENTFRVTAHLEDLEKSKSFKAVVEKSGKMKNESWKTGRKINKTINIRHVCTTWSNFTVP